MYFAGCGGCLINMEKSIDIIVERIRKRTKNKDIGLISEVDFIDLLNFGLKNQGVVNLIYSNRKTGRKYEHQLEFRDEYKNYKVITHTYVKISDIMRDFKFPLR